MRECSHSYQYGGYPVLVHNLQGVPLPTTACYVLVHSQNHSLRMGACAQLYYVCAYGFMYICTVHYLWLLITLPLTPDSAYLQGTPLLSLAVTCKIHINW